MSKRVCNKRGEHVGARCRIHLGYHKRRRIEHLSDAEQNARMKGDSEMIKAIEKAIKKVLPQRFFRRGVR